MMNNSNLRIQLQKLLVALACSSGLSPPPLLLWPIVTVSSVSISVIGPTMVRILLFLPSFPRLFTPQTDLPTMATYMQNYGNLPAQFRYGSNNGVFVSSFIGDGFPSRTLESTAGISLFACPNWQPSSLSGNDK
jgi:hypothetical protein